MNYLRQVLTSRNLQRAIKQVKRNKGSCGVDGMEVDELNGYFRASWTEIKLAIENGTFQPSKVLGVEIDKPDGGKHLLGIPTAIDRVIQQMKHQVLSPVYDVEFSTYSYGFRPGKNAHQAIHQALDYINSGYQDIIDLDLKSFFDVVNHDYLMSILYRKAKVKEITRKTIPKSFSERIDELNRFMKGWINYFKYAYMPGKLKDLDLWIRNRLRYCI